jgi:hypothetical protein
MLDIVSGWCEVKPGEVIAVHFSERKDRAYARALSRVFVNGSNLPVLEVYPLRQASNSGHQPSW